MRTVASSSFSVAIKLRGRRIRVISVLEADGREDGEDKLREHELFVFRERNETGGGWPDGFRDQGCEFCDQRKLMAVSSVEVLIIFLES